MLEFLKLSAVTIGIACLVGTGLGLLVKLIVEPKKSSRSVMLVEDTLALGRSLDDLQNKKVVPFADVNALLKRNRVAHE
jgi:hypothetical protein